MTATITKISKAHKLDISHIKEGSIPSVLEKMESADTTIVIHLTNGRWDLQLIKGQINLWGFVGMLQVLVTHFSNVANGVAKQ